MSNDPILSPLDLANLQSLGLFGPGTTPSSHRLHKRRVNRFSDEEYRDIPLSAPLSSQDAFFTIPATVISLETLTYVGLSSKKSKEIWKEWTTTSPLQAADPDDESNLTATFLSFILERTVNNTADAVTEDDLKWRNCLDECGINKDTQDAIMDPNPKLTYMRLSDSCLHWARDTIEMRYAGLGEIQRTSRMREVGLQEAASSYPIGSRGGG
ncbi:hypothetical protein V496_08347 [Pseudogymnoascus sp. VKM F-4515 (FW-2607)]|nr:hypothetical protein V496_08347 [Pseudogymnoascus sp. VKM F-4515 (FW-2607)]